MPNEKKIETIEDGAYAFLKDCNYTDAFAAGVVKGFSDGAKAFIHLMHKFMQETTLDEICDALESEERLEKALLKQMDMDYRKKINKDNGNED